MGGSGKGSPTTCPVEHLSRSCEAYKKACVKKKTVSVIRGPCQLQALGAARTPAQFWTT